MAGDRSQLGKVLAEIDRKIAVLQAAKAEVLAAIDKRGQRKPSTRRRPEAVAEKGAA